MNTKGGRKMKKTIVHETDVHSSSGVIYHDGVSYDYSYNDEYFGDVKTTLKALADIGIIDLDNFIFFEGNEIYNFVQEKMEEEDEQSSFFCPGAEFVKK